MGKASHRAAFGASRPGSAWSLTTSFRSITTPTLIVTTQESGLQSVEAVERYAQRFPNARVIILPGDSYHIAAVEPDLCARHALRFMAQASKPLSRAAE